MERPDVLVLGAGGTIGAAWMSGVLAGLSEAAGIDFRAVEHVVGTSAGSMVAADLLAGREPRAPSDEESEPDAAADREPLRASPLNDALRLGGALAGIAARPLLPATLSLLRPATARVRAALLGRIPSPSASLDDLRERIDRHGLQFDGRLRVVCVEREAGRRVVFGSPGAPDASVAAAVQASCSVPWTHHPVRIGEHEYVDGAVWSPTNLDVAPALRATHVLCLAPTGGPLGSQLRHPAIRAAATAATTIETQVLRRRGAIVELVVPEPAGSADHPRVVGYRQGLALAHER